MQARFKAGIRRMIPWALPVLLLVLWECLVKNLKMNLYIQVKYLIYGRIFMQQKGIWSHCKFLSIILGIMI